MNTTIDVSKIDWALLRKQKHFLIEESDDACVTPTQAEHYAGLLALIDYIQDEAANVVDEQVVFGPSKNQLQLPLS